MRGQPWQRPSDIGWNLIADLGNDKAPSISSISIFNSFPLSFQASRWQRLISPLTYIDLSVKQIGPVGRPRELGSRQFGECDDAKLRNFLSLFVVREDSTNCFLFWPCRAKIARPFAAASSSAHWQERGRRPKGSIKFRRGRTKWHTFIYRPEAFLFYWLIIVQELLWLLLVK